MVGDRNTRKAETARAAATIYTVLDLVFLIGIPDTLLAKIGIVLAVSGGVCLFVKAQLKKTTDQTLM